MKKRAQVQLSFGMIFSVIIIAVTLGVASYVIWTFVKQKDDIACKTFYVNFQDKINKMWSADSGGKDVFVEYVPDKSTKVCFGSLNQTALTSDDKKVQDELSYSMDRKNNLIFYPSSSCGTAANRFNIAHIKTDNFFCVSVSNSRAGVKLSIGDYDSSVTVTK